MFQLLSTNELHAALKAITKSVAATRQRVQSMAEQAVAYSIVHGDVSVGNKLLEAVGVNKSLRRDSLVAYLEKFGNFAYLKAEKKLVFFLNTQTGCTNGVITDAHYALITSSKWDEAKREAEIVSKYDMEAEVRKFIDRMHKLARDGNITIEHPEALAAVEQSFVRWSAANTLRSMTADQAIVEAGEAAEVRAELKAAA
jgi:hypothetical protein